MSDREPFDRAFVATTYLLDRHPGDALEALPEPRAAADQLAARLEAAPDRQQRAAMLAAELGRLVAAIERRRLR